MTCSGTITTIYGVRQILGVKCERKAAQERAEKKQSCIELREHCHSSKCEVTDCLKVGRSVSVHLEALFASPFRVPYHVMNSLTI